MSLLPLAPRVPIYAGPARSAPSDRYPLVLEEGNRPAWRTEPSQTDRPLRNPFENSEEIQHGKIRAGIRVREAPEGAQATASPRGS